MSEIFSCALTDACQGDYPKSWWQPILGISWQIQLSGTPDISYDVQVYDLDLFNTPQGVIGQLHALRRKVICYINAGSWEDWRPDADQFPASVLGRSLEQVAELLPFYDWALNGQCFQYNECQLLLPFVQSGKPVFGIEYYGDPANFCPQANSMDFDVLKKLLGLDAWKDACR